MAKTEHGKRNTEEPKRKIDEAPTATDGVDYPLMVCPGCGTTDNVVMQSGRDRAPDEHTRIRQCRVCGMKFKEHVP